MPSIAPRNGKDCLQLLAAAGRPIRSGDPTGTGATAGDPDWTPLFPTPPHPDYLSGHATNSSAMATILMLLFGDNPGVAIVPTSPTNPGFPRQWARPSEGVEEVINARIYSGIHFRTSDEEGGCRGPQNCALRREPGAARSAPGEGMTGAQDRMFSAGVMCTSASWAGGVERLRRSSWSLPVCATATRCWTLDPGPAR